MLVGSYGKLGLLRHTMEANCVSFTLKICAYAMWREFQDLKAYTLPRQWTGSVQYNLCVRNIICGVYSVD